MSGIAGEIFKNSKFKKSILEKKLVSWKKFSQFCSAVWPVLALINTNKFFNLTHAPEECLKHETICPAIKCKNDLLSMYYLTDIQIYIFICKELYYIDN